MTKWVEIDPRTGVKETCVIDERGLTVHKEQDVTPLVEHNKELKNTRATDIGIKNGMWHYCSIPNVVQYELLVKHGINITDRQTWPRLFDIINKEYPDLKTTDKVHAYRNASRRIILAR